MYVTLFSGSASSKPCLCPITDTECQSIIGTNIKINIFVTQPVTIRKKLFVAFYYPWRYLYIQILLFTSLLNLKLLDVIIINENPYRFHNNVQFCIFVNITKSSFCHVFVAVTAYITFQNLEIINNSSKNTCSLSSNITLFVND